MNKSIQAQILKLIYVMLAGTIFFQILSVHTLSSLFFYATMFLTMFLAISRAKEKWTQYDKLAILIAFVSIIAVLIDSALYKNQPSLSDYTKFVSFLLCIFYFATLSALKFDKKTIDFVLQVNTFIAITFVGNYVLRRSDVYIFRGIITNYLTFRFTNPNLASLFLLCCTIGELIHVCRKKTLSARIIHALLAAILTWFIYETDSRNALLSISFFLVFVFCQLAFRRTFRMSRRVAAMISIFPFLFFVVYMLTINKTKALKLFNFLISSGKALNSRVSVWKYAWTVFSDSPIIGSFMHTLALTQLHNSHIDILASYGGIVFPFFCLFLYYILLSASANAKTKASRLAVWGFAAILIAGVGEAAFFSGGLGIYAYAGIPLLIANESWEDSLNETNSSSCFLS